MFGQNKKNDYPLGSRQNPIVRSGSSSQAGLQAIKNRKGGPAKKADSKKK